MNPPTRQHIVKMNRKERRADIIATTKQMQGTLGRLRVGRPNEHKSKLFFQSKQQKKNKAGAQAIQESGSN